MTHYAWPKTHQFNHINGCLQNSKQYSMKNVICYATWPLGTQKNWDLSTSLYQFLVICWNIIIHKLLWVFAAHFCLYFTVICSNNEVIMGHRSTCTNQWPTWPTQKVTHLAHWPMTHRPIACSATNVPQLWPFTLSCILWTSVLRDQLTVRVMFGVRRLFVVEKVLMKNDLDGLGLE